LFLQGSTGVARAAGWDGPTTSGPTSREGSSPKKKSKPSSGSTPSLATSTLHPYQLTYISSMSGISLV
jgi:hypothetical protein